MNPLVSIILPTYNVANYIEQCTESIRQQEYSNLEVIFVNDGSTDNTRKVFDELQLDSRFQMVTKKNEGSGFARNYGLSLAKGKYVYFMDPDDLIEKNIFSECIPSLEKNNSEMLVFGYKQVDYLSKKTVIFKPNGSTCVNGKANVQNNIINLSKYNGIFAVWNKIYRRSFLLKNKLSFSKLSTGQDAEFNWKLYDVLSNYIEKEGVYYTYFSKRTDSAQTRYNSSKFTNEVLIFRLIKYTVKKWNKENIYKQFINNYQITICVNEALNLGKKSNFSLKNLENNDVYKEAKQIKYSEISGLKRKIKLFLIKNNGLNIVRLL